MYGHPPFTIVGLPFTVPWIELHLRKTEVFLLGTSQRLSGALLADAMFRVLLAYLPLERPCALSHQRELATKYVPTNIIMMLLCMIERYDIEI